MKIVLYRGWSESRLIVDSPIQLSHYRHLPDDIIQYLHDWARCKFFGFEISAFLDENDPILLDI